MTGRWRVWRDPNGDQGWCWTVTDPAGRDQWVSTNHRDAVRQAHRMAVGRHHREQDRAWGITS